MLCSLAAYSHSAFLFCCILCLVVTHFGAYLLVQLCFSTCFCTFSHFSLHITFHSQIHISCTSFLPFLSFPFFAFSFPLLFPFPSRFLSSLLYEQYEGPHRDTRWNWILILLFFYLLHKSKLILWRLFFFYFSTVLLWSVLALRDELLTRCTFARLRYIISCGTYSNLIFVAKQKGWRDNCISPGEKRICWTPPSFLRKSPPLLPQCEMSLV